LDMTNFSKYSFVGLACGVFLAGYAVFAFTPPPKTCPGPGANQYVVHGNHGNE